jgi:hypothetical protein
MLWGQNLECSCCLDHFREQGWAGGVLEGIAGFYKHGCLPAKVVAGGGAGQG